jgi:tRNA A37 threonylcarbamoyladenosine modification protein TsaB
MFLFVVSAQFSYAQSEAETLEWLNVKKGEIYLGNSTSNTVGGYSPGKTLLFDENVVKLASTDGAWTGIGWKNIKDIKVDAPYLEIVSDREYENKKSYVRLYISSLELREKYVKALKHMATLKGAQLVKDDLF